jgi:hypothetical protein
MRMVRAVAAPLKKIQDLLTVHLLNRIARFYLSRSENRTGDPGSVIRRYRNLSSPQTSTAIVEHAIFCVDG